ncbi:MAG: inner membrane CreD family protein, partial [Spirochaetaceae bacterium]|nr:inner membrane CreD family protein [Spirochaetaceae bacterium]
MNTEKKESFKKFTKGYTFKALVIAALVLLLLIPLSMIGGLVRDRERTAREAESGIMEAWGGELVLAGPVLVFPGSERVTTRTQTE